MPAYILKVLAPAAQSFIRHSHATLPSAACSPIDSLFTQDPKIWCRRDPKSFFGQSKGGTTLGSKEGHTLSSCSCSEEQSLILLCN